MLWLETLAFSNKAAFFNTAPKEKRLRFARNPKSLEVSNKAIDSYKGTGEKRARLARKVLLIVERLRVMFRWRA